MTPDRLRVAVIGTNGCAESHHRALAVLEAEGLCEVVATCDPWAHRGLQPAHIKPGLKIHPDHRAMLTAIAGNADYVVIPTPIHLHGEMHRDVLAAGFACYLEKPPTLDPSELVEMAKVEAQARRSSFVGFSHLFRPEYAALKERIQDGEFGALREVEFLGMWPRTRSYFERNSWAGRLLFENRLILDSCLGNGMAHHANNCLFWSGRKGVWSWDHAETVRAHLYRANRIEAPDTIFLEAGCSTGVRLRMALTHACSVSRTEEVIRCDGATIRINYGLEPGISIQPNGANAETIPLLEKNSYVENHRWFMDYLKGKRERPCTLLEDCRAMVLLNSLAFLSAGSVMPVENAATAVFTRNGREGISIVGIERAAQEFLHCGVDPDFSSERSAPPRWVTEDELPALPALVRSMAKDGRVLHRPSGLLPLGTH